MTATHAVIEMIRYLKMDEIEVGTIQIKDLEETVVNAFEDIREYEDESAEVIE